MRTSQTYRPELNIYIQQPKSAKKLDIICRCCEEDDKEKLTIHHTVPRFIGKHLDHFEFLRCRTVILCNKCHNEYEYTANKVRIDYGIHYNIPANIQGRIESQDKLLIRKSARILSMHIDTTPAATIYKSVNTIKSHLNNEFYTYTDLQKISTMDVMIDNPDYIDIGKLIADRHSLEDIKDFWYKHYDNWENYKISLVLGPILLL